MKEVDDEEGTGLSRGKERKGIRTHSQMKGNKAGSGQQTKIKLCTIGVYSSEKGWRIIQIFYRIITILIRICALYNTMYMLKEPFWL